MNTLIAIGTFNALFFALLIFKKQAKTLPDRILSLYFLCNGLALGTIYATTKWGYGDLLLLFAYSNLFFAPLIYLYVASMVAPDHSLPRRWPWFFLPLAAANIYLLTILSVYTEMELVLLYGGRAFGEQPLLHNIFYLLDLLAVPVASVISWQLLRKHQDRITDLYSYRQSVDYRWIKRLILFLFVSWVLLDLPWFGRFFFEGMNEKKIPQVGGGLYSLIILYIGYFGFRQVPVYIGAIADEQGNQTPQATEREISPDTRPRYRKSGLSEDELQSYKDRLLAYTKAEQPYLDPGLSIRELAGVVGLSEHNISEVLNVGLDKRFYDFVNGYRVDEFKQRIAQPQYKNQTILAVALQCGFNSKSSFNRIFKQHAGQTPSAFVKGL